MWNDLGLIDKARMMQLAVKSGITDLRTIEEVYNTYASGGEVHKLDDGGPKETLMKYKGTNHDPLQFNIWTHNPEDAESFLINHNIRESEVAPEVAEFFRSYASSNGIDRIIKNQKEWYKKYHPIRKIVPGAAYDSTSEARKLKKNLPGINAEGVFDLDAHTATSGYSYKWRDPSKNITIIGTEYDTWPYGATVAHEMMHGYNYTGLSQGEALDLNVGATNEHDQRRDEKHSDIEALKWILFNKGIYDARGDVDATADDIRKLREILKAEGKDFRSLEQMTDEQAAWMINHVADASEKLNTANLAASGGKIHIKPQNRGKFTALKERTGHSASWFKAHGTPAQKKMAVFALNARKWKHDDGGPLGTENETLLEFLGPSRGEYLPQVYKEYFTTFKNYDDFNSRALIPDESRAVYDAMAQYYYNNDPNYASYFKLTQGPYKTYTDLRNKYEKNESQMVDLTSGNSYKLSSLGSNNRPTNKHGMRVSENLLNYIYDNAAKAGVDPKTAIALAVNESNLGNARAKNGKVGLFDLYSYWAGTDSVIYPNSKTTEPLSRIMNKVNSGEGLTSEDRETLNDLYLRYNKMAESIHPYKGNNVVADAVKYFNEDNYVGRTLPEETRRAYRDLVMSRFDELMNDQRFRVWWESKNQ